MSDARSVDDAGTPAGATETLRQARRRFERDYIADVLRRHGWSIPDTARALGLPRPNLYRKARQLGIRLKAPDEEKRP
jgi:DNA-binding NtrC family response regulator